MRYRIDHVLNVIDDGGSVDEYYSVAEDADGLGLVTITARDRDGKETKYLSFEPDQAMTVAAALIEMAKRVKESSEVTFVKE